MNRLNSCGNSFDNHAKIWHNYEEHFLKEFRACMVDVHGGRSVWEQIQGRYENDLFFRVVGAKLVGQGHRPSAEAHVTWRRFHGNVYYSSYMCFVGIRCRDRRWRRLRARHSREGGMSWSNRDELCRSRRTIHWFPRENETILQNSDADDTLSLSPSRTLKFATLQITERC